MCREIESFIQIKIRSQIKLMGITNHESEIFLSISWKRFLEIPHCDFNIMELLWQNNNTQLFSSSCLLFSFPCRLQDDQCNNVDFFGIITRSEKSFGLLNHTVISNFYFIDNALEWMVNIRRHASHQKQWRPHFMDATRWTKYSNHWARKFPF